jgi:hypothetical protein
MFSKPDDYGAKFLWRLNDKEYVAGDKTKPAKRCRNRFRVRPATCRNGSA